MAMNNTIDRSYRLAPMQQGMLFHSLSAPGDGVYIAQTVCEMPPGMDVSAFEKAWQSVVDRHDVLRTGFLWDGLSEPIQRVCEDISVQIDSQDWTGVPVAEQDDLLKSYLLRERKRGFDLSTAPLMRFALLKMARDRRLFLWTFHHMLLDGRSRVKVMKEVSLFYEAYCSNQNLELPCPPAYADYIDWFYRQDRSDAERYWRKLLGTFSTPVKVDLPGKSDKGRSGDRYQTVQLSLSNEVKASLQWLARSKKLTINLIVQAAWAVLLARYGDQEDVVFGETRAGRRSDFERASSVVGLLINTIPIRLQVTGSKTFLELLQELRAQHIEIRAHESTPLTHIREASLIEGTAELFQSIVVFEEHHPGSALHREGCALWQGNISRSCSINYPLTLIGYLKPDLSLQIDYDRWAYSEGEMERFAEHLTALLEEVIRDPSSRIADLRFLTHTDKQVLKRWNQTEADYAEDSCVHQLFEEQVEKTPEAVAVVFEDEVLSYGQLNRRANQLGHYLRELGVGADARVGLCLERSVDMVVGVLGILKAGGAYLPLDPQNPLERSRFLLEDAGVAVLLTQQHLLASLPQCSQVISLDTDWDSISQRSESNPQVAMSPENLAYVMYTSGSTGTPKGVSVVHRNVVRFIKETNYAEFGPDEVFLQMAPMSFDASTLELWASLLTGAKLVVLSSQQPTLPQLGAVLAQNQVTTLWLTAGLFHLLVDEGLDHLVGVRQLLAGGDALSVKHVKQVLAGLSEGRRLINGYGPTENTTFSCCHVMDQHSEIDTTVPIGRPMANTQVYVLDQKHQLAPLGVAGELYLGGDGLARGYLNGPELTAEKFIPHPFSAEGGARLYRTGDRVRYLESGELEFLGRLDQQVKLRGFRIELEEIQLQLAGLPGINTAVVVAREDEPGDKKLVAYITLVENGQEVLDHDEVIAGLRRSLQSRLPEYMVPSAFVILDTFPLTPNGKLDRKALPAPDGDAYAVRGYEAPVGEIERAIASIWAELLKLERVGRHDNFFNLGGHSLLAMRMISQLRKALAVEMAVRDLFAHPVLTDYARLIESAAQVTLPPITHCERSGPPLSFAQQRLWLLAQMGASEAYHIFYGWRMKGQLDRAALRQALNRIVARHEALRTTFVAVEGEPRQRIAAAADSCFRLLNHDLSEQTDSQEALDRLIRQEAAGSFDLAAGPLIRGRLMRLRQDEHALLINMHHIVSDGWSESVLMKELSVLYAAFTRGEGDPLPELEVQYADYAVWQRQWMEGEVLRQQAEYWQRQLAGAPALLELPTDHARPAEQDYTGGWVKMELEEDLTRGLKELSKQNGVTLYMTLLAGWAVLLGRLSGQAEVVIGTPVANRGQIETEGLIGFFVNTLALRIEVSGSGSVGELLWQVKEQVLAAQQHQDIPFEQVVELARPVRSLSHSPIFQVIFDWQQNVGRGRLMLPGLELEPLGTDVSAVAKFDLTLSLVEVDGRIVGGLKYATALYDESTVARYLTYLRRLLRGMVAEEMRAVERLPILPEDERRQVLYEWNATEEEHERRQLLYEWNATAAEYPRDRCVHELIEEQAEKTPEAVAVVFEDEVLSYGELNRRANQLGHYLRELGVGSDARVGICVERGLEMMVGLLGILKAGGAYVPLDPAYPQQRLQYMVADSAPVVLLTQAHLQGLFAAVTAALPVLELDAAAPPWRDQPQTNLLPEAVGLTSQHLAYVIYTSGSTGVPKGVAVQHRSLLNLVCWHCTAFNLQPGLRSSCVAGFGFDAATWEIWPALCAGATVLLPLPLVARDPEALLAWWSERGPELSFLPTPIAELAFTQGVSNPLQRTLLVGGDHLRRLPAQALSYSLINNYGPTEATVVATSGNVELPAATATIGRPIANTQVYILDRQREPAPVGVAGELYIGGEGLARGYLNRGELTAERFVSDPFAKDHGARMYRTGDQVRWLADGRVEFLGRIDHQVKVRGYRIELGEIEARLIEHEAVREAVVMAREEAAGDKRLVAYYTSAAANGSGSEGVGAEELRRHLSARLPEYMVPAAYVHLEQLPLTPNGKLDRKALPAPDGEAYAVRGYEAPVGEIETAIASIWAELLKLERVGRHDNFFELGGNSLLGMRLIQRMRRAGLELDVRTLFATPVLVEMASTIRPPTGVDDVEIPPNLIPPGCEAITPAMLPLVQLSAEEIERIVRVVPGGAANIQDIYPLAPLQEGLLFHHLMGGEGDAYVVAAAYSFDNRERLDRYLEAMQAVVDRHDILRTGVIWEGLPEPLQVVWRKVTLPVEEAVLETGAGDAARQLYTRYNPRSYRIDLRQAPPLRVVIAHDEEQGRWLMLKLLHHLAGDLTTSAIMHDEIQAYLLGQADRLPAPLPFRNLVARARLGVSQQEHEEFFRRMLGDVEEPTAPFGLLNVHGDGTGIESARMNVEAKLALRIRERARKLGVSAAVLCHVAWALVVARASERDDVVFGTVLFGRMQSEEGADRAMGVFINTLPVRVHVGEAGVEESVRGVHKQLAELLRHEHASLALAQRCSAVTAPTPLFSSLLNYLYGPAGAQARPAEKALAWEGIEGLYGESRNNYPLNLAVTDLGEAFRLTAHVEPSIGAYRVCQYMHRALESLVEALEGEPERALRTLNVVPESERQQVLYEWNATEEEYARDKCVQELFEEQVEKTPAATAVVFEEEVLSYGELNRRANQLAHYLREQGVGPDQRVAICTERGVEMIVGLLGVLKAGGTYVPLDPAYPQERLQYMLEHSAPRVLLTQPQLLARLEQFGDSLALVDLTDAARQWSSQPVTNLGRGPGLSAQHLAYLIYTSGSTGLAKAVMVTHQSVVNLFCGLNRGVYGQAAVSCRRVSVNGPLAFDTSVKQVIQLLGGHALEIIPEGVRRDGEALLEYVRRRQVEVLDCTPSQLGLLLEAGLMGEHTSSHLERLLMEAGGLRPEGSGSPGMVLVGGEAIEKRMWEQLGESELGFFNMYGPTECTGDASVCAVQAGTEPSIGRPLANTVLYVLDQELEAVPVGVAGELYIGGAGVARGYWGEAGATAEKFVADPYSGAAGVRMYRTGDLGRRSADGAIQFLGRNDFQVKVRGYRIEPNEIASVLEQHPAVRKAVVTLHPNHDGLQFVAYVVLDPMRSPYIAGGQRYKLPNKLAVVHLNRNETDFLYQEMFEIQAYFKHGITVRDGDCVFDVGANIGLFSLAAHLRAKDLQIYAFEPSPLVFDLLKTNMQLYSVDARLSCAGLSREKKSMPLTFYPKFSFLSGVYADSEQDKEVVRSFVRKHKGNGNGGPESKLLEELLEDRFESREIEVNLVTFSDTLRENNVRRVDLLKINVEKSEMDVLAGIEDDDWPKIRQIALEVHDIDGRLDSIVELLSRHGYKIAVEQDWQLEESTKTNFYVYARRDIEDRDRRQATPTFVADQLVTPQELRAFVAQRLPEYMVPAAYVPLDALPLTPNGKVDRKRLPAPEGDSLTGDEPPVGELETTLAEVWGKVLRLDQVGRRDNFFELGGHSLLAVRVVNLLEQANINILVGDLFTYPTIELLARKIGVVGEQSAADMPICLKEGGGEKPFFLVHPSIFGYYGRVLAPHVDDGIPVYSVPPRPLREAPDRTLEAMAMRMVQMIRAVQPEGPYRIGGYSNGGPLAYEIAAQLLGADQKVDFLGLIDAYYRGGSLNTSTFQIEIDTKQALLRILEDAWARPDKYVRRVSREAVDELTRSARTMDLAAFLRQCQDRLVLPIRYDNLTAAQLQQSLAHDRANELADLQYYPQPLPIPVHFFLAQESQQSSVEGWKSVVPPELLRIIPIEGNHQSIMDSPNAEGFGRVLSAAIRQAAEESGEMRQKSFSPLIGLQSGRPNITPHFWMPGAGASVTILTQLVTCMDRTLPVYGLEPRGLEGDLVPHSSLRAAAEINVAAINEIYPRGPVHLLGHSFGGWVAFQMAHLLLQSGRTVASLTILDKEAPDQDDNVFREYTHTDILMDWINGFELVLGHPLGIGKTDIESLTEANQRELLHRRLVAVNLMPRRSEPDVLRGPLRTFAASIRAHYKPDKLYTGPLTLILVDDPRMDQTSNRQYKQEVTENWKRCAPNLVCAHGPGNHLTMLREPHVRAVADLTRKTF